MKVWMKPEVEELNVVFTLSGENKLTSENDASIKGQGQGQGLTSKYNRVLS